MRLVVCIDRDDDLGRKAGVAGPIVGRAAVIDAATRLGIADPEDSDTNAMFAAVRILDEILKAGDAGEVCVLTGSPKVGLLSDTRVAEQFDQVLERVNATSAHLVSDGAEDEHLFPILASRLRIDGVHRVYIRQSASIESTYYTIIRAMKDPKLRAKTILPVALVLLVLGIAAAGGVLVWGVVGIAILLGVYLIFWTFDIDEGIIDAVRSASRDVRTGSVAFGFGLFSVALVGVGFLEGYNAYVANLPNGALDGLLSFLQSAVVWWIIGALLWECGRALRRYLALGRFPRSFVVATTSVVGIGFMSYGVIYLVQYLQNVGSPAELPVTVAFVILGLGLVITAGILQQYFKSILNRGVAEPSSG
jgi:putative membrane protein